MRGSRGHKTSSKVVIGLIINTTVKPSRDVMYAVAKLVHNDPVVEVRFFQGSPATTAENLVSFAKSGIDGLIICGFSNALVAAFHNAMPDMPPIVQGLYSPPADDAMSRHFATDTIVIDNEQIGVSAADYFLKHALQSFAFFGLAVPNQGEGGQIRRDAFFRRIAEKSALPSEVFELTLGQPQVNGDFWVADGGRLEKWLDGLTLPCGLFINGEMEAYAIQKKCAKMGLKIPEQIELLCIDHSLGFCETATPTLSHMRIDFEAAAGLAVEMLMARIRGKVAPDEVREERYMNMQLVERGSTASGRGYGSVADRVKEYVRVHACEGIDVPTVAKQLGISRRTIEKRVREATGQSVLQMIRAVRLAEVCRLLSTTEMTISEITQKSGYQLTTNLSVTFKKMFGMSMREYRTKSRTSLTPPPPRGK